MILESSQRPLSPAEKRLLSAKIGEIERRGSHGAKALLPGVVTVMILWILTLAASDADPAIVTSFWAVVGAGILLWVRRDLRKDMADLRLVELAYESARRRSEAREFEIRAQAFAEFEEVEDEGACYAFELNGERLAFVNGQQFYPQARFPSHHFSLVHLLDEDGNPVDEVIVKHGPEAAAARMIPAEKKLGLDIPEHLEVIDGTIDEIERLLASNA
jgi:hypothetical protein